MDRQTLMLAVSLTKMLQMNLHLLVENGDADPNMPTWTANVTATLEELMELWHGQGSWYLD